MGPWAATSASPAGLVERTAIAGAENVVPLPAIVYGYHGDPGPIAAGAKEPRPPQDYGFMFGRSFDDPDGHIWEVFWMGPAHVQKETPDEKRKA